MLFGVLLFLSIVVLGLTSCENSNESTNLITTNKFDYSNSIHKHTYSSEWSYDDFKHWHISICGHNLKDLEEEHIWNKGVETLEGTKFTCTKCGYEKLKCFDNLESMNIPETIYVDLNNSIEILPLSFVVQNKDKINFYSVDTSIASINVNRILGNSIGNTSIILAYGTEYKMINVYVRKNIDFDNIKCEYDAINSLVHQSNVIEMTNVDVELVDYYSISYDKKLIELISKKYNSDDCTLSFKFYFKKAGVSSFNINFKYFDKEKTFEIKCESYLDISDLDKSAIFDESKLKFSKLNTLISLDGVLPDEYGIKNMIITNEDDCLSEYSFNSTNLNYHIDVLFNDFNNHSITLEIQTYYGKKVEYILEFKANKPITEFKLDYESKIDVYSYTTVKITIPDGCDGYYKVSAEHESLISNKTSFINQVATFTVYVCEFGYQYLTITVFSDDGTSVSKDISIYGTSLADKVSVTTDLKCEHYWDRIYGHAYVKSYSIDIIPVSRNAAKIELKISWEISNHVGITMAVYNGNTLIGRMNEKSINTSELILEYSVTKEGSYDLKFESLRFSYIF